MDFDTLFLAGVCASFLIFAITLGYISHTTKRRD